MKFIGHHHINLGNRCLKLQLRGVIVRASLDPDPAGYLINPVDLGRQYQICMAGFFTFVRHFHQITREILNRSGRIFDGISSDSIYVFFRFVRHFHQITIEIVNKIT